MEERKSIKLCFVQDKVQAEMVMDILQQNGICAYEEGIGNTDVMEIYAGNSTLGKNIFICDKDLVKAKELTKMILDTDGNSGECRKSTAISRVVGIGILAFFLIAMVYIFYISI